MSQKANILLRALEYHFSKSDGRFSAEHLETKGLFTFSVRSEMLLAVFLVLPSFPSCGAEMKGFFLLLQNLPHLRVEQGVLLLVLSILL